MFIKKLIISSYGTIIRNIPFHKGLNLIIDETISTTLTESGNNVGKTTVLRLIDFALAGKGKNIYQDPEFPDKSNTKIERFLKDKEVLITLVLKEDLEIEESKEILIERNFLSYGAKIQKINGEGLNDEKFEEKLKSLIFNTTVDKPTFRQIISKNIRDEKNRLNNTLKVLHQTTTLEEYEALFFFWFGIDTDSASRKQKIQESLKIEKRVLNRLKRDTSVSEIEQALAVIERDISALDEEKNTFNLNENYLEDIDDLNNIKERINQKSTQIGKIQMRRDLILESKIELEDGYAKIDTEQLKDIYSSANAFIPKLQKSFEDLIEFHNSMLANRVKFVTDHLPILDNQLIDLKLEINNLRLEENEISTKLSYGGAIQELERIIFKLNIKFEQKGGYEEQLKQWNLVTDKIESLKKDLKSINEGIDSLDEVLKEKVKSFNRYFSTLSEELYGEQFILSEEKDDRVYRLKISSIGGNLGTGKKKGQIAAFDFAYIKFCEENDIPCLNFLLYDQIENIHDNQLNLLAKVANESNCQLVASVLRDKLPPEIDIEIYKILTLSQGKKLFKIS